MSTEKDNKAKETEALKNRKATELADENLDKVAGGTQVAQSIFSDDFVKGAAGGKAGK